MKTRALALVLVTLAGVSVLAQGQSIALTGSVYNQSFDTLMYFGTATNTLSLEGWYLAETGGSRADGGYVVSTGSLTAGDSYSYGAEGSSERALGCLRSGALVPLVGAAFTNELGTPISGVEVAYTGEQWRLGATGRADRLDFQYSLDATSLTSGTWTDLDELDFSGLVTAGTVGPLNGNSSAHRSSLAASVDGLSLAAGATLWIRWSDFDAAGSDDGLAIDDFSISAKPAIPEPGTYALLLGILGAAVVGFRRWRG